MLSATHVFWSTAPRNHHSAAEQKASGGSTYRVAHDPTGDYRVGAEFTSTQVGYMLADGTFDDGLVIERDGRRWTGRDGELVRAD